MYPHLLDANGYPKPGILQPSSTVLSGYGKTKISQLGMHRMTCKYEDKSADANFFVADEDGPVILGLPTALKLKLVTVNCAISKQPAEQVSKCDKESLLQEYPECFSGIGNFSGEYHIVVDPTHPPVVHAPRKCPIQLRDEVKVKLDNMESLGVIKKVDEPTDWVNSVVYSRKPNGKLRICLDPKDLNKAIKRCHHTTPTLEELTHKFEGCTVFSKLDARHGYWAVKLDEESSLLTTFNSPFGRYRFLRMPFGLKMSQDVFQNRMDQILEACDRCVVSIADDVAVGGCDQVEIR